MSLRKRRCVVALVSCLCCSASTTVFADELNQLKEELRALRQTVDELKLTAQKQQALIDALSAAQPKPIAPSEVAAPSAPKVPFVPDIGAVADITGSLSESNDDEEGHDRISAREVELVIGHDIDPYSRFDATFTISDFEAADIEEAYISYWDLPGDLKGRIGRLRPKVGKASALHRDSLDTTDEPFVVQRYFGAEGLFKTGLEISGFTPLAGDSFTQQLAGGVLEGGTGEEGELFGESGRHPTLYSHLGNFFEIDDAQNVDLGGTYLAGSNAEDQELQVQAIGVDATYTYYATAINKFKFQNEAYLQERDDSNAELAEHPWGFYSLADYRFSERWGAGSRYDYVELVELPENFEDRFDQALTGYLTFYQSEFARWRAQYQYADLADGQIDNRFSLQGTFAIGIHKHQLQ